MNDRTPPEAPEGASSAAPGLVGPNAISQLAVALQSCCGDDTRRLIMRAAGLRHYIDTPPVALVAEIEAARLFATTRLVLPDCEADAVLADAGRRTADYVVANRIPRRVRRMLHLLPAWTSARLLLLAIQAHAWTFAGSGAVAVQIGRRMAMSISGNPLATPGCPWHVAVLERMLEGAIATRARVTHLQQGDTDRFEIMLTA